MAEAQWPDEMTELIDDSAVEDPEGLEEALVRSEDQILHGSLLDTREVLERGSRLRERWMKRKA